jgi:integrase
MTPKNEGAGQRVAEILRASFCDPATTNKGGHQYQVAQLLITYAGTLRPSQLTAAHVLEVEDEMRKRYKAPSTKHNRSKALRQILRWLWENWDAPKLDGHVRRFAPPRPRNVCVRDDEKARILGAAPPHVKLWLLLCSDLAIRSGTAILIAPEHYNEDKGTLTFKTKCDERLTLPVTEEIAALLATCNMEIDQPFVHQLWYTNHTASRTGSRLVSYGRNCLQRVFRNLQIKLNITRNLHPHDFRRTTAVAMLRATGDIRDVQAILGHKNLQSTFWYLDHEMRPVERRTLELIKTPAWGKERTA